MSVLEPVGLIGRKRDGGELTAEELQAFVGAYLVDQIDDAQMAAFLMAGVIRGFTRDEAVALTDVLLRSGGSVDLSGLEGPTVDKHSTGGVGDVTTLVVAPLLAAAGCQVAKLSGRGLGHTGGTLDKLEAIPGFRVDLDAGQLRSQVERVGVAVAAATTDLVPADKRLYALRDVTGTVADEALIASSVMSKKLAGGAQHILLDVKTGDGAFMAGRDDAISLARLCVEIGAASGRRCGALVTDMSQPLGDAIGNALEVAVAVETLQGTRRGRLRTVCEALAASALALTGIDLDEATSRVQRHFDDGSALEVFGAMVDAQGGDVRVVDDPRAVLPAAAVVHGWSGRAGTVQRIACRRLGELAGSLGAGRRRQGDTLDLSVGIEITARVGDVVDGKEPIVLVHARSDEDAARVLDELDAVVAIDDGDATPPELIIERIGIGT